MNLDDFFNWAWTYYLKNTPKAKQIADLLTGHGESIVNDHIALRTFDHPKVKAQHLARFFIDQGYKEMGKYDFPTKKVQAWHYQKEGPPGEVPKVFISELRVSEFSDEIKSILYELIAQIPDSYSVEKLFVNGRPWNLDSSTYKRLAVVSEYASWVAAWGFRPNHFTVLVNKLKTYNTLPKLNKLLKYNGFSLNTIGGEIKGSPDVYLEQSATMADKSVVVFDDGEFEVPSCYYEFAYRYPLESGELFEGFVSASADKLFESTNDLGK